jgi:hypothetical protein
LHLACIFFFHAFFTSCFSVRRIVSLYLFSSKINIILLMVLWLSNKALDYYKKNLLIWWIHGTRLMEISLGSLLERQACDLGVQLGLVSPIWKSYSELHNLILIEKPSEAYLEDKNYTKCLLSCIFRDFISQTCPNCSYFIIISFWFIIYLIPTYVFIIFNEEKKYKL